MPFEAAESDDGEREALLQRAAAAIDHTFPVDGEH
jgi:hypothetical protein